MSTEIEKTKAELSKMLPASLYSGLKNSPTNPTLRAAAMARLGVAIPDRIKAFKTIESWVEENVEPPKSPPVIEANRTAFSMRIGASELRYGRARWSAQANGSGDYEITAGELEEIIAELRNGEIDFRRAVLRCKSEFEEMVQDDPPVMEEENYDYEEHETNDSSDFSTDLNMRLLQMRLHGYISFHHPDIVLPPLTT